MAGNGVTKRVRTTDDAFLSPLPPQQPPVTVASVLDDFGPPDESTDNGMMPDLGAAQNDAVYEPPPLITPPPEGFSVPLSPGPSVYTPPQAPQTQVQYAPPRAARRAPQRGRGQPAYMGAPVPPAAKPSLASLFQSKEGVFLVSRMDGDREAEMIGREFPRAHVDACGGNLQTFLIRHVVPEHGGGTFLIRAMENNGEVGSTTVTIAGPPKKNGLNGEGSPNDPRVWASVFRQPDGTIIQGPPPVEQKKTLKELMADNFEAASAQAMIERMSGGGSDKTADALTKLMEPIKNQMNGLMGAVSAMQSAAATPAVPQKDAFDRLIEWELMKQKNAPPPPPAGPSPEMLALTARLEAAERATAEAQKRADRAEEQRREDARKSEMDKLADNQKRMEEGFNNKLNQLMAQLQQPQKSIQDTYEEWKMMSDLFGGGSKGDTKFGDVLGALADKWTPEAIGEMADRVADATVKEKMAEEKIRATRLAAGESEAEVNANPTQTAAGASSGRITIPTQLKNNLKAARTEEEILAASMLIVRRLLDVPAFADSLNKLRQCISHGYEEGIESHIRVICESLYGTGGYGDLVQRMTLALMNRRVMVCSLLKIPVEGALRWKNPAAHSPKKPPVKAKVTNNVPAPAAKAAAEPPPAEPVPAPDVPDASAEEADAEASDATAEEPDGESGEESQADEEESEPDEIPEGEEEIAMPVAVQTPELAPDEKPL